MPELIEIKYTPAPNPFDENFQTARVIFSQIGMSVKLGLSLRKMSIINDGFIATIGSKGTSIRVQIVLNRGQDLYEVSVGRQSRKSGEHSWIYNQTGVYCDQLTEVISFGFEAVHGK
jgi:hypothetical protein